MRAGVGIVDVSALGTFVDVSALGLLHTRTDMIKRAKRFLFYKSDPFPRASLRRRPPPTPVRAAVGGGQEW